MQGHHAHQGPVASHIDLFGGYIHLGKGRGRAVPVTIANQQGRQSDMIDLHLLFLGHSGTGKHEHSSRQAQDQQQARHQDNSKRTVWVTRMETGRPS